MDDAVVLDDSSVLIHPDAAERATPKPTEPTDEQAVSVDSLPPPLRLSTPSGSVEPRTNRGGAAAPTLTSSAPLRRFHGTADIDPRDPIASFTEIVQNVIEHFTAQYGTQVTLSLDIEARRKDGGFDQKTIRIARENATTLKFKTAEFEEE